jgi:hypothetical protein
MFACVLCVSCVIGASTQAHQQRRGTVPLAIMRSTSMARCVLHYKQSRMQ